MERTQDQDPGDFVEVADPAMVVVTVAAGEERAGCLAGFHTQCSIDPPRYAVLISKANHTCEVASRTDTVGINLLDAGQVDLARLFGEQTADDGIDKFDHCRWTPDVAGPPRLEGAAGWVAGEVLDRLDVGDHVLHVLRPVEVRAEPSSGPLRFTVVEGLDPGHSS